MTDEQIAEYLRARARVAPPLDLVASVGDAIADVRQRRRSWFAPFVPAAAAVAATAVVLVAAVLVGQDPQVGPPPPGSPVESEPAAPTPQPTVQPTPAPTLLGSGDSVTIDAVDPDGRWGTITLTRGDDLGGYDDGSVPPDSFVIELHVRYVAERAPEPPSFGAPDWTLVGGADGQIIGERVRPGGQREATHPTLATYPGAIDIFANTLDGWLLFVVPREAADFPLELRYQPSDMPDTVTTTRVRAPGEPPDPVALATPPPTPGPVSYTEVAGYPFTVIESSEADELFETPDTCTNPEAGYTVTYPDEWFTNTEIGEWSACTWFSPVFYDVGVDPNAIPPQVAIVLNYRAVAYGYTATPITTVADELQIGGWPARRAEELGRIPPGPRDAEQFPPIYFYIVDFSDASGSLTLRAQTDFEGAADYELNKAVLDRIMALIEFDEAP